MKTYLTAALLGLGTLCAPMTADASWLSEALRNSSATIHFGPPVYPAYVAPPVCAYPPPPCAVPAYVVPVYTPPCHSPRPVYIDSGRYGRRHHHDHHHRHYR
jgi:hypothetical protein